MTAIRFIAGIAAAAGSMTAGAGERILDLPYYYLATSTFDPGFNPALDPDMDQDGSPDLSQADIQLLVTILADADHPDHETTHAAFTHNENIALAAILSAFPPQELFIAPVASLWAVYMTIQGDGAFEGPTLSGMPGLVELIWNHILLDDSVGPVTDQNWIHSAAFGGAQTATLSISNGGAVFEGEPVVMTASASGALAHRWFKNDGPMGAGGAVWEISSAELDDAGDYHVEIDVTGGATLETDKVTLIVSEAPDIPHRPAAWAVSAVALAALAFVLIRRIRTAE